MSKAQIATEFLLLVMIGFTMLLFSVSILGDRFKDNYDEQQTELLKDLSFFVQNEVDMAVHAEYGYSRTFNLPADLDGISYQVQNTKKQIILKTVEYDISITVPEINGTLVKGQNTIRKTDRIIINQ